MSSSSPAPPKFHLGKILIFGFGIFILLALVFVSTDFNISKSIKERIKNTSSSSSGSKNKNNKKSTIGDDDDSKNNKNQQQVSSTATKAPSSSSPGPQKPAVDFNLPLQPESLIYRQPIENGTLGGRIKDPGRFVPCMMTDDLFGRLNNDPKKHYGIYDQIPRNQIIKTHLQDGQYCFAAWTVSNVVLQYQIEKYDLALPVIHVPSKKYVGADMHFHNYQVAGVVLFRSWQAWRKRMIDETEPMRYLWYKRFLEQQQSNNNNESSKDDQRGSEVISDQIIQDGIEMAKEMKQRTRIPVSTTMTSSPFGTENNTSSSSTSQQQITTATSTTTPQPTSPAPIQKKEDIMMDYLYDGLHNDETDWKTRPFTSNNALTQPQFEELVYPQQVPPTVPRILPIKTEYAHALQVGCFGVMPAVVVARLLSGWGSFYSSGLQALGSKKITLIVNKMHYQNRGPARLVEAFSRHFPVPAIYLPENVTFYARRLTFSIRSQVDVVDPCAFHFNRNWLLPSVVNRIKFAMRNGRDKINLTPPPPDADGGMWKEVQWSPHNNIEKVEGQPGVYIRHPVPPEQEVPWWPKEYDELIRNPPENIFFFKNPSTAYSFHRSFPKTEHLTKMLQDVNFTIVSDSSPHDVRMYLINHAKRVVTMWGGGETMVSYLWAGGVENVSYVPQQQQQKKNSIIANGTANEDQGNTTTTTNDELSNPPSSETSKSNNNMENRNILPGSKEEESKIRYLDIIILIHPGYDGEFNGLYRWPLERQQINVTRRQFKQNGLQTYLCPPSPEDHWSEAAQASRYAWSKMIKLSNIDHLRKDHLFITDEEKSRDLGPLCKEMNVEKKLGPRWKSKWDFKF